MDDFIDYDRDLLARPNPNSRRFLKVTLFLLAVLLVLLVIGAIIYSLLEDVNFRDSLWMMVATATTIGTNETPASTTGGHWFRMVYSLMLVIFFIGSFFVAFANY